MCACVTLPGISSVSGLAAQEGRAVAPKSAARSDMASKTLRGRRTAAQENPPRPRLAKMQRCPSTSLRSPSHDRCFVLSILCPAEYRAPLNPSQAVGNARHFNDQSIHVDRDDVNDAGDQQHEKQRDV